jgi:hypothetical protein
MTLQNQSTIGPAGKADLVLGTTTLNTPKIPLATVVGPAPRRRRLRNVHGVPVSVFLIARSRPYWLTVLVAVVALTCFIVIGP